MPSRRLFRSAAGVLMLAAAALTPVHAQDQAEPARIEINQSDVTLEVGDTLWLIARVFDSDGNLLDVPVRFFSGDRRKLAVSRDGKLQAMRGGNFTAFAFVRSARGSVREQVTVAVAFPPVDRIVIHPAGERFFVGATLRHEATVIDAAGIGRPEIAVRWSTSDAEVATVDRAGGVVAHKEGRVVLRATGGGVTGEHTYRVVANPIRTLTLEVDAESARTGDVIHVSATALDGSGRRVENAPISYTLLHYPVDSVVAQFPGAEIDQQGRFVAYEGGSYTVVAVAPGHVATQSITITQRNVSQHVEMVGQGAVRKVRTSDLWVWEGKS